MYHTFFLNFRRHIEIIDVFLCYSIPLFYEVLIIESIKNNETVTNIDPAHKKLHLVTQAKGSSERCCVDAEGYFSMILFSGICYNLQWFTVHLYHHRFPKEMRLCKS